MRKLTYALAAAATLAIGAPTIANAQGFGVYVGGDHGYTMATAMTDPASGSMSTTVAGTMAGIAVIPVTAIATTAAS